MYSGLLAYCMRLAISCLKPNIKTIKTKLVKSIEEKAVPKTVFGFFVDSENLKNAVSRP